MPGIYYYSNNLHLITLLVLTVLQVRFLWLVYILIFDLKKVSKPLKIFNYTKHLFFCGWFHIESFDESTWEGRNTAAPLGPLDKWGAQDV